MRKARFKLTLYGCVVAVCCVGFGSLDNFAMNFMTVPGMLVCSSFLKKNPISSATVSVRAGGAIWLNPFATVLFTMCCAVTAECCVLYPCCLGVFGMVAVM